MISTIIICRNARPTIEACVNSIRKQTKKTDELIVVDGNSEDGTVDWLLAQPNVCTIRQPGSGIANARNLGIRVAKGDYIAFLDADDLWVTQKLDLQCQSLQAHLDIQAVTGHLSKSDDLPATKWVAMTPGGFLFRRAVFDQVGLFNEQWVVASDHEWLMRAIRQGMNYLTLPDTLLIKGIHETNLSIVQKKLYRAEMLEIMRQ